MSTLWFNSDVEKLKQFVLRVKIDILRKNSRYFSYFLYEQRRVSYHLSKRKCEVNVE